MAPPIHKVVTNMKCKKRKEEKILVIIMLLHIERQIQKQRHVMVVEISIGVMDLN